MAVAPPRVVECPYCNVPLNLEQAGEYDSTHCWTDGKNLGWKIADFDDELFRCEDCWKFFWRSATTPVIGGPWVRGQYLYCPSLDHKYGDAQWAIHEGFASDRPKEINLRLRLLWTFNNPFRAVISPLRSDACTLIHGEVRLSDEFVENNNRLIELLDAQNPRERLLQAELYRETGRFDSATFLLAQTAERFFQQQEREIAASKEWLDALQTQFIKSDPRAEGLILLARQIMQLSIDKDTLVRPAEKRYV